MKIPFALARVLKLLIQGERVPASQLRHPSIKQMLDDGVLLKQSLGAAKALIAAANSKALAQYIQNHFGIIDLDAYILLESNANISRTDAVLASGDSKLRQVRTFRGFPVQTLSSIEAAINGQRIVVAPVEGTSWFIERYENFVPAPDVTIIGIENGENFQRIREYGTMFLPFNPLFVCRYPQSGDLIQWLKSIYNNYLHFGDLDFAGIKIYLHEFHCHFPDRARFFIPDETESLLQLYGNRELYQRQRESLNNVILDNELLQLTALFHKYGKVLEQEVFIGLSRKR
jgi:hypothetical protein